MVQLGSLQLQSAVFNSSCPWASEIDQLRELYASPSTGAVTTRTATLAGFAQDPAVHDHVFLADSASSLNRYGYSPHPLSYYLDAVRAILLENPSSAKPFIISITSSDGLELERMGAKILALREELNDGVPSRVGIEINTSCPNIPSHPPPSYSPTLSFPTLLDPLLTSLPPSQTLGLKLPPYVHIGQFNDLLSFLGRPGIARCVSYLACCNTLGGTLGYGSDLVKGGGGVLDASKFAGLAGAAIHPLALGNVARFRALLDTSSDPSIQAIQLVGIGGAADAAGVQRFLSAGAAAVACATILGINGVSAFNAMAV